MNPHTLTPILNREGALPADGWYHVVPRGEFAHPSGVTQVIDERATAEIVNRFAARAAHPHFSGLLVDQEHFSYDTDKSSEAYGWMKEVQNRADGVWGRIEWTDLGQQALAAKRYKFVSPVWVPAKQQTEPVANAAKRLRPLELDSLGLTNNPNLKGMVPLTNRADASAAADPTPTPQTPMKSVATLLGLSPEASEEAILAAVTALRNRAQSAETELAPLKNRVTELEGTVKSQREAQVEADLAPLTNRTGAQALKPEVLASWKAQLLANREQTLPAYHAFVAALGATPAATQPLTNRSTASVPATPAAQPEPDSAEQFVAVIKNRAAGTSKADALRAAMSTHPKAYAAWRATNGTVPLE